MTLPKIGIPSLELKLPSSGKDIKYRPFLVKEEKILLLALESEDDAQITSAVKELLKNCVITRIKVDDLPSFDLEYLFLKIRAASVGEIINMKVTCQDDNTTQVDVDININDVQIYKPEGHTNKIMLSDDTGIIMKYPSMKRFIEAEFLGKDLKTTEVFDFIADHMEQIFDKDVVYDSSTTTKKEFLEFLDTLTIKQFEQVQKFYDTMPRLKHEFEVVNPNTNIKSSYTIEGLQNFFA
jgi:hypothetical protein